MVLLLSAAGAYGSAQSLEDRVLSVFAPREGQKERFLLRLPGLDVSGPEWSEPVPWARLVDIIPLPGRTFLDSGRRVSAIYGAILQQETSPRKSMARRQEILNAKRLLADKNRPGQFTDAFKAYRDLRAKVFSLRQKLESQSRQGVSARPALEAEVREAEKALRNHGENTGIRGALDTLAATSTDNIESRYMAAQAAMGLWEVQDANLAYWYGVEFSIPQNQWESRAPWTRFSHAGGGPADPSMEFEGLRIEIIRPWMDEGLYEDRRWRLLPSFPYAYVSSGFPDDGAAAMPMYVSGFLLARKFQASSGGVNQVSQAPFQIIGLFCRTVPKSPDPLPSAFLSP